jgi:hypothetical protein
MGPQDPKNVARDTARDLSGLVGELAALKADAHHWLTDPEYAALRHSLEATHAAAEAALVVQRSTYQRSLIGCLDCETRERRWRGGLLPPSGRPTQVGTTLDLMFRAAIRTDGEVDLGVAL